MEVKARVKEIDREVTELERKMQALLEEDRTNYAQGLIDKIFSEFKAGANWTRKMKKLAEEEHYVFAPNGRKRHLWATLTGDKTIVSQQVRRGSNAPIQGMASEIGVKAGRVISKAYYKELPTLCKMLGIEYKPWSWRVLYNRMVHDANYYSVPFAMVIPYIHILQWGATYGVTEAYKKEFNFEFTVEPEIEIEVGSRDDLTNKWDWSLPNIVAHIQTSVKELDERKELDDSYEATLKLIFRPWAKKETRHYLQKHYPLLGVHDLDKQIRDAIRPIYK